MNTVSDEQIVLAVEHSGGCFYPQYDDPNRGATVNQSLTVRSRDGYLATRTECPEWYDVTPRQVTEARQIVERAMTDLEFTAEDRAAMRRECGRDHIGESEARNWFLRRRLRKIRAVISRDGSVRLNLTDLTVLRNLAGA